MAVLAACGGNPEGSAPRPAGVADGAAPGLAADGRTTRAGLCDATDAGTDPDGIRRRLAVMRPTHMADRAVHRRARPPLRSARSAA